MKLNKRILSNLFIGLALLTQTVWAVDSESLGDELKKISNKEKPISTVTQPATTADKTTPKKSTMTTPVKAKTVTTLASAK